MLYEVITKIIENHLDEKGTLTLHSLNSLYKPYTVSSDNLREIWRFVHYISSDMPEENINMHNIAHNIASLQKDVESIKNNLSKKE